MRGLTGPVLKTGPVSFWRGYGGGRGISILTLVRSQPALVWGGWGSVTPREEGVQGQSPAIRRALREMAGGLCACAQTPALRGECRCARRSARRKRCAGSVTPAHPAEAPGASWRSSAGGALRKPPRRAQRARMGGAGRGKPLAHHPTGASGDRAHTRRPAQAARLCKAGEATGVAGCGLAKIGGLCYGWRAPSRRLWRRSG